MKKTMLFTSLLLSASYLLPVENVMFSLKTCCSTIVTQKKRSTIEKVLERLKKIQKSKKQDLTQSKNYQKLPKNIQDIIVENQNWIYLIRAGIEQEIIADINAQGRSKVDITISYYDYVLQKEHQTESIKELRKVLKKLLKKSNN